MSAGGASRKHCFVLHIDPAYADEYLRVHDELWPELAIALRDAGYRNYSVFLDEASGTVVGYVETDDFEAMVAAIQATEVNARFGELVGHMFRWDDDHPQDTIRPLRQAMDLDTILEGIDE